MSQMPDNEAVLEDEADRILKGQEPSYNALEDFYQSKKDDALEVGGN